MSRPHIVFNDARPRFSGLNLRELWSYRDLFFLLTWRDVKVRYKQTVMGAAWAIIQPLSMMVIFSVFFGLLMGIQTDGMPYAVFFYCGLVPWTFFSSAVNTSSSSLVNSSYLITKVYFPRVFIPAAAVCAGIVDVLIASTILVGLSFYYGIPLTLGLLILPLLVLEVVLLALAVGVWLAALTVKHRDVRHALPFVLQVWFFVTPIIYSTSLVPEKWRWVMSLNPLTGIVEGIRAALGGKEFDWPALAVSLVITLAISVCSVWAFRRIERSIADLV
jgi:lipopolysaccharide transport system permease protein